MNKLVRAAIAAAAMAGGCGSAHAADVTFTFADGTSSYFYSRDHLIGTTVSGILHGLVDNSTSQPTSVEFTSVDSGLGLTGNVFSASYMSGNGFGLSGGVVTSADFFFNFNDNVGNAFQLRLNSQDFPIDANWLFWNGGSTPVVGTGNTLGFSGVTFGSQGAVPEPATWAMMLLGFGMVGFAMRKRSNVRTTVRYA